MRRISIKANKTVVRMIPDEWIQGKENEGGAEGAATLVTLRDF